MISEEDFELIRIIPNILITLTSTIEIERARSATKPHWFTPIFRYRLTSVSCLQNPINILLNQQHKTIYKAINSSTKPENHNEPTL